jgi:hypothetical protein
MTDKVTIASYEERRMPGLTELDPAAARDWIARWDRQQ